MRARRGYGTIALASVGIILASAGRAEAQRSGFIIGVGLGPGHYSMSNGGPSKTGVGLDFHLGGVVGDGFEIYWMQKATYTGSDNPNINLVASGVGGIGFAYPVSPKVDVHAGIGAGVFIQADQSGGQTTDADGLGLAGGARYHLDESGRWMLNGDIMYGKPFANSDVSVVGFQLTINVMSH